jgi:hypothetical protein
MADELNRNKLAALWLCYVTNHEYRDKLNRPIEQVLADKNFLDATGLDETHIRPIHERVFGKEIMQKLDVAREAFWDVFQPVAGAHFWDSSSPTTDVIAYLADRESGPE